MHTQRESTQHGHAKEPQNASVIPHILLCNLTPHLGVERISLQEGALPAKRAVFKSQSRQGGKRRIKASHTCTQQLQLQANYNETGVHTRARPATEDQLQIPSFSPSRFVNDSSLHSADGEERERCPKSFLGVHTPAHATLFVTVHCGLSSNTNSVRPASLAMQAESFASTLFSHFSQSGDLHRTGSHSTDSCCFGRHRHQAPILHPKCLLEGGYFSFSPMHWIFDSSA